MSCPLDEVTQPIAEAAVQEVLQRCGVNRLVAQASTLGAGVQDCAAVRLNRALTVVEALVAALTVAAAVAILRGGGRAAWASLHALGTLSTLLLLVKLRHALSLGAKVAWYGLPAGAKALAAVTLASLVARASLDSLRDVLPPSALNVVVGFAVVAMLAKLGVLLRSVVSPPVATALFTAVTSAADRVVGPDAVARLKAGLLA